MREEPAAGTGQQAEWKAEALAALAAHPFTPTWWLRGPHRQSIWGPGFRRVRPVPMRHECWETPDADFLDLHFYPGDPAKPLVLLLHGLEGSAQSFYILALNRDFHALGWEVATLVFRTCGGRMNLAKRMYHMGETSDLDFVAGQLRARIGGRPLFMAGVSLGGNVLGKWLGEQGARAAGQVTAAAIVSPPFDPALTAPQFHAALGGFYVRHFLATLIPKAIAKERQHPGILDPREVRRCRDFYAYDTVVTARLHGFADAMDYWRQSGCRQWLPRVRVPTLLIAAEDDPFNHPDALPRAEAAASPWLHPLFTALGGHAGFVTGPSPARAGYWAEEQVVRFFQRYAEFQGIDD